MIGDHYCCNRLVARIVGFYLNDTADSRPAAASDTPRDEMTPADLGNFPLPRVSGVRARQHDMRERYQPY